MIHFYRFILIVFLCLISVSFPIFAQQSPHHNHAQIHSKKSAVSATAWKSADKRLQKEFKSEYESELEARSVFIKYLPTLGAQAMLDYLELNNPRCHGEAHELGKALFAHNNNLSHSLMICGNRCTNACMHGVMGEAFGESDFGEIIDKMNIFCSEEEMSKLHKPGNCAHGFGHALMIAGRHNLAKALSGCEKFENQSMVYYCATGVFMEYRGKLRSQDLSGKSLTGKSIHYPCDQYTKYPAACYRYMLRRISKDLNAGKNDLIDLCNELKGKLRNGCFHGLGAMYSRKVADNPELLPQLCRQGTEQTQIMCIEGVIEKMADFNQQRALQVCELLEGKYKNVCVQGAQEKMYRINKSTMDLYVD